MARTPHNWIPEPHQLPVLMNPARFKTLVWHRKAHKTTLAINELIRWANALPATYWYVAPYYSQAKKIVWDDPEMFSKYCPPEIWANRNNSELKIVFPNGSIIYVLGADKPDSLRGPNPYGIILDEYGDMKSEVWSAIIQPIMTANPNSWCWFIGTPKGRNDFFSKFNMGNSDNSEWWSSMLKASQSGIIDSKALEEAKKTTTQAFYNQEYECEFAESAGSFFRRITENLYDATDDVNPEHLYQLGVDLAKYQDWTVITPFDLNDFAVKPQIRFNQIDWNLQKARIEAIARRYNNAKIMVDSTGVGDPITEDLEGTGLNVEGVKFTDNVNSTGTRRQLLDNLAIKLEQDMIKLPNDEGLIRELQSFQFKLKTFDNGKSRISVETMDGMTDDRVMSLALAVFQTNKIISGDEDFSLYNYG